jgi:hypothetical protein
MLPEWLKRDSRDGFRLCLGLPGRRPQETVGTLRGHQLLQGGTLLRLFLVCFPEGTWLSMCFCDSISGCPQVQSSAIAWWAWWLAGG